ncbi:hypothetical protein M422DRAFT_24373, partial [Sphaerobolus stellatus SS14]
CDVHVMSSCDVYLTGHSLATEPFSFWIPVIGGSLKVMVSATIGNADLYDALSASSISRLTAGTHRYGSNAQLGVWMRAEMAVAQHDDSGRAV